MRTPDQFKLTVFRFEDLSQEKDLAIFCRSFSGDLITEFSRFRQFQLIKMPDDITGPGSIFEKSFDSFGTDYFVQGSFRSEKEMVRINVQLYNSNTRHMVWGNRFEGKLEELSELQDNLLAAVAGALQQQINYDLLSGIRKRPKTEFKAYEFCLHGMEELKIGSIENDERAREHFQHALKVEPDYSLAHTGMSLTFFNEWSCQLWERWDVSKSGAYQWAQRAIELDDHNYMAAMVLGRIFLYEGAYDTAEYYLRRSLMLNPNDADTLIQISMSFAALSLVQEGLELYEKAILLNPFNSHKYFPYGALLYFELGQFEKAATLILPNQRMRVADADAYYAAIYYNLQQYDKMHMHWNGFLETYRRLITKGRDFPAIQAANWIMQIHPYKHKTNLEPFLRYISNGSFTRNQRTINGTAPQSRSENYFYKEGASWKLSYENNVVQVLELKGFCDLQKLLINPRQFFHCAELMGSTLNGDSEKLIDEKSRKQYQQKILELQNDIQEAERSNDFSRIDKLQYEYDQLIDYLSKSLGLKGKSRETGSTIEKARSAITWRIRNAIARIEQYHPLLGAHLSNAVKTGMLCSYQPDREINWITA